MGGVFMLACVRSRQILTLAVDGIFMFDIGLGFLSRWARPTLGLRF